METCSPEQCLATDEPLERKVTSVADHVRECRSVMYDELVSNL